MVFFLAVCLSASKRCASAFRSNIYHHSLYPYQSTYFSSRNIRSSSSLARAYKQDDNKFVITAPFPPTADQPEAIKTLVSNVRNGDRYSILRGCTGTGKTMVMAHSIAKLGRPTLVLCHNKTLAAQLARELRACFQKNHVQLFVSYYNHYVPESFSETTGKYVAKKSSINDELDALRHMATRALVQHRDVVVIASVSCIYGLGMPKSYLDACLHWTVGDNTHFYDLQEVAELLEKNLYVNTVDTEENEVAGDLSRGQYEFSKSDQETASVALWQPSDQYPMRIDLLKHENSMWTITNISVGNNRGLEQVESITIFPAKHHISETNEIFEEALRRIENECIHYSSQLRKEGKNVEADRLQQRVSQDLVLLKETGSCPGVENYSRHFNLREEGEPPDTLLDYFGMGGQGNNDWLLMVDESHVTLSQLKAMYGGDRARKQRLVKHGYRLPSALDNRPLREDEFWNRVQQSIFVSATPRPLELSLAESPPVDMVIRPTYVCDPVIERRPIQNQLKDLVREVLFRAERNERTLALSLTKRDAEDLSNYLQKHGVRSDYIHSGLNTHERSNVLKALQSGTIDCLVGVNILREGLDLPQVSLVAILNADAEGFLRSQTALLQMIGRAARNVNGMSILYADRITGSMKSCIEATKNRRKVQLEYNSKHGKEMRSTSGSSIQSIFEILKDQIEAEQQPLEIAKDSSEDQESNSNIEQLVSVPVQKNIPMYNEVITDHIPSKPGVYFWKDDSDRILYIGKAKRLRSRVKSYLTSSAKHSLRIKTMLKKATKVEFLLTPSDRDALILESNLIKHHQPPYNVLLKDDVSYPYICASIGDFLPSFSIVPRKLEGAKTANYMYFGPYPHYGEINKVMEEIEIKYELRSKSFQTRFGPYSRTRYHQLFQKALDEVFLSPSTSDELPLLRSKYEEGSILFDSIHNQSRDVVAIEKTTSEEAIVHIVQLREGLVAGQFSYTGNLASGIENEQDLGEILQAVMERQHYPQGEATQKGQFSFFPNEILIQYPIPNKITLREAYRTACLQAEPSRTSFSYTLRIPAKRGQRKETDERAMQFAKENIAQVRLDKKSWLDTRKNGVTKSSVDGTALRELQHLLALKKEPYRIECYDISHTQGDETVGSRVVFESGIPRKELYRKFNIKTVQGVDDYASIEEVLERRFHKAWVNGSGGLVDDENPWCLPDLVVIDGGKGQLSAALKGMANARVFASNSSRPQRRRPRRNVESHPNMDIDCDDKSIARRYARVPVISLAKQKEDVYVPDVPDPINNSTDSAALLLLRSLRDESHRFALQAHQRRRSKANGFEG